MQNLEFTHDYLSIVSNNENSGSQVPKLKSNNSALVKGNRWRGQESSSGIFFNQNKPIAENT